LKRQTTGRMDCRRMAQKNKNQNFKAAEAKDFEPAKKHSTVGENVPIEHSIDINPCLTSGVKLSHHNPTATDKLTQLKRLYKKEFGYKPTNKKEDELESILQTHCLRKYGTPDLILEE